ncbi:isochorismate synthase [Streptosporangium sp. NPDC023963]|uniref:isochorismate synthase n=1 Tax=Streptosporangium sp. NPDC023963 TaxID=3155608 RepID=UPI00342E63C9
MHLPNIDPHLPNIDPHLPDTDSRPPGIDSRPPGTAPRLPGVDPYPLDIDLPGFLEVHAKATAESRNSASRTLATWRQEIDPVDPAWLLAPVFARTRRAFVWVSPESSVIAMGSAADFVERGSGRFAGIRASWERAAQNAVAGGPGRRGTPSLVGGFAFAPRPGPLPEALMWVPRVLVARDRDGRTTLALSVSVDPGNPVQDDVAGVIAQACGLLSAAGGRPCPSPYLAGTTVTEFPSAAEWKALVARAADQIGRGRFDKAVLARQLRVTSPCPYDVPSVLGSLLAAQSGTTVFAVAAGGHAFVGATPERLVSLHAGRARSMSLAASMPRGATPAEDARLRAALLEDDKSRREQQVVTAMLRRAFDQVCREVSVPAEPQVLDLPNLRHLHSRIDGEIADPENTGVLDLVERLHPTPAVGGHPREGTLDWISAAEPFDRGWYAGPVGWMNTDQEGDFAVALRSAHLHEGTATLYAGCGIVAGSDPDVELQETRLKFRPMLNALAVPAYGPDGAGTS